MLMQNVAAALTKGICLLLQFEIGTFLQFVFVYGVQLHGLLVKAFYKSTRNLAALEVEFDVSEFEIFVMPLMLLLESISLMLSLVFITDSLMFVLTTIFFNGFFPYV